NVNAENNSHTYFLSKLNYYRKMNIISLFSLTLVFDTALSCFYSECSCRLNGDKSYDITCMPARNKHFPTRELNATSDLIINLLFITKYDFKSIPNDAFDGLSIKNLILADNQLESITEHAFRGIKSLNMLRLIERNLQKIETNAFFSLAEKLEDLDLVGLDIKNDEYKDVIYYTLGQLEEREKNYDIAFKYYKLSASKSKTNDVQKSKSYLRIAEMSFDKEDYPQAKTYYDSTIAFMKEDAYGYKDIISKKNSLDVLVGHINTIKTQDSLLKLAAMDSSTRNDFIKKMIKKIEEDELKAKELAEQAANTDNGADINSNNAFQPTAGNIGQWYFYNQQTKAFGVNDFIKKWGNQRKNEDNWRRSNKQSTIDPWQTTGQDSLDAYKDSLAVNKDSIPSNTRSVAYYLKNVPLTKALQDSAHQTILNSYYSLGTIYREQLNNNKRAVSTFNTMNQRYSRNEYEASSYYQMYRIYLQEKNTAKAEECKNFLINNYPNSDYTQIIKDPNFASAVNAKKSEVEAFYTKTYELYTSSNYAQALGNCNEALKKYSKNDYSAKFALVRALCIGKTQTVDSLERALISVIQKYPSTEVDGPAKAMLDAINKAKNPNSTAKVDSSKIKAVDPDAFKLKDSTAHYWVVCVPQSRGNVNAFKTKLSNFNNEFYSVKKYQAQTLVLNTITVVFLKTFTDKTDVLSYNDFILKKIEVFADLQKENISVFGISEDNMILLIKKKNIEEYKTFFNANYVAKKPL
ncbi:MAG: hypothetical protein ACOVLD_08760, partial [Bacteroidia bacterium]